MIEIDGVRVLTDPHAALAHGAPAPDGRPPEPGTVDAVLVSHGHYDHLDLRLARAVAARRLPVILPRGLRKASSRRAGSATWSRSRRETKSRSEASSSVRRTRITRAGRARARAALTVGFAVLGSRRVFFAGDTDLFPEMDGLVGRPRRRAAPDLGLGADDGHRAPRSRAGGGGADAAAPEDRGPDPLGDAPPVLQERRRRRYLREPPAAFAAAAARLAPEVTVRVLAPGEAAGARMRAERTSSRPREAVWAAHVLLAAVGLGAMLIPSGPLGIDQHWADAMKDVHSEFLRRVALVFNSLGIWPWRAVASRRSSASSSPPGVCWPWSRSLSRRRSPRYCRPC